MLYTRREIASLALAAGSALPLLAAPKPNSKIGGVQIGIITYSFRALPESAEETLRYCVECGISGIELMSNVAEVYAGAPAVPPTARGDSATAEQRAAHEKAVEARRAWRTSVSMDKYKQFRKMYENAGVKIYAFKLPPALNMPDAEYEYIWNVTETLGANHVTMELPTNDEHLARVAKFAAKRKIPIAFHTHGQGGSSGFDKALNASPYTALNLDVGHYYGVTGESPLPIIEKYASRISSLHIKDRKGPEFAGENRGPGSGGPNMPFGQGGTPIKEILQLMKAKKYKFPASIEYEYQTPQGSDVLTEIKKCANYCKAALA